MGSTPHKIGYGKFPPDPDQVYVSLYCANPKHGEKRPQIASFVPGINPSLQAWAEEDRGYWDDHQFTLYNGHRTVTQCVVNDAVVPLGDPSFHLGDPNSRLRYDIRCKCGFARSLRPETLFPVLDTRREQGSMSLQDLAVILDHNGG